MSNTDYEIEIKFAIPSESSSLNKFLGGIPKKSEEHTKDVYYDTADAGLFKRGVYVRVRNGRKLEFKYSLEDSPGYLHTHCIESGFDLPMKEGSLPELNRTLLELNLRSASSFDEFVASNGLTEIMAIEKHRRRFFENNFCYALDSVAGLGDFLEVDRHVDTLDGANGIKDEIRRFGEQFGLRELTTGYFELHLRKNNPELYRQSRYVLKEDLGSEELAVI